MERIFKKNDDGNLIVEIRYTPEEKKSFEKKILEDSAEKMLSEDYKDRFLAEYRQTKLRFMKLGETLEKYKKGTLDFEPTCSIDLLEEQWNVMRRYVEILVERARIEEIDLQKE